MRRHEERLGEAGERDRLAMDEFGLQPPTRDQPWLDRPARNRIAPPSAEFKLRMWSYDIAREQCPTLDHLRIFARMTEEAGYNALGLYLEHRFKYECAPWANGVGAVDASMIRTLQSEFPSLKFIPMINLLGHMEGFIYTEYGSRFAEERFKGLQACPSNPEFVSLCEQMVDEIISVFDSDIIHIGGDETKQLGKCPSCLARVREFESDSASPYREDGHAGLYSEHFVPLCERVLRAGRRPAVWGDMLLAHPRAELPRETLVFDWQYHSGVRESATQLIARGYEVVGCPTLKTFNAPWMDIDGSEENIEEVVKDVEQLGCFGVCLTTWEAGLFGSYMSLLPAIVNVGGYLCGQELDIVDAYNEHGLWALLMGRAIHASGFPFLPRRIRSELRCRFLLMSDPFLFWRLHGNELDAEKITRVKKLLDIAGSKSSAYHYRIVTQLVKSSVEFVECVEQARTAYAENEFKTASRILKRAAKTFNSLSRLAKDMQNEGLGSIADESRCKQCRESVLKVAKRIESLRKLGLGYVPSFEHITHPKYTPHDQGAWWRINQWADE